MCPFSHEKRRVARLRDGDRLAGHIEVEPAEDCSRQALALVEALGMRPLLGHCKLGLGALHTKIGRREQAQAELTTAMALFRALEMTFWLPEAEAMECPQISYTDLDRSLCKDLTSALC